MTSLISILTQGKTRAEIRKALQASRKNLTPVFQENAANALCFTLQNDVAIKNAKNIAVYLASNAELDLQPFIQWCWQQNKQVYLPVVHPFSKGNLLFLRYHRNSTMVMNQYNIAEPTLDVRDIIPMTQLDLILTPLVGFDVTGARIGMGGGYYDRTLVKWYEHYLSNQAYTPFPIGIAHDCQQVNNVPIESWDIPLPKIITPTRVIQCSPVR